ncbi:MAG: MBL fold metallo-hydrolase [Paludibacteraceae bacterium]|nr:MBL fold metallo-hydrolase [Paludibacteraceae bacterium]
MRKLFIAISTMLFAACAPKYPTVMPDEFEQAIAEPDVQLVDVRTPDEYEQGHIVGAMNIDWKSDAFADEAAQMLDKSKTVAVYCRGGRRSHEAGNKLYTMGYTHIVELQGGLEAWKAAGKTVQAEVYECDEFLTPNGMSVKLHALVHASIWMEAGDKQIFIDPVSHLGNRSIDYTTMPTADFILITHGHHDHLDKEAIHNLSHELYTQVIANQASVDILGKGIVMANGDKRTLTDKITIEAVPAYNTTEGHLQFHPKGRDNGYILTIDGLRIYIAGDTEDIPEMADVKDIDIAFLPCNQPYTMTPEQVIKVAKIIRPKVLFPYHYSDTDLSAIPAELPDMDVRIRHYK